MFQVQVLVKCYGNFSEILLEDAANTEFLLEELVSREMLGMCEEVILEDVTITLPTSENNEQWLKCSINIKAKCLTESHYKRHAEHMELVFEGRFSAALLELFGDVKVVYVVAKPIPPCLTNEA